MPLRALSKRDIIYTWESSQQAAFKAIQKEITKAPLLAYFDKSKPSIIQQDVPKKGLRAVLLQDGKPVIYACSCLTETEQHHSNTERELLSVVFAFKQLHHYVYSYTVRVQTNHQLLVSIWKKTIASSSPCLKRLLLQLSKCDINIEYINGKENAISEVLSRVLHLPITKQDEHQKDIIPIYILTTEIPADSTSEAEFRKATAEDTTLGLLMQAVMKGSPKSIKDCYSLLLDYWTYRDQCRSCSTLQRAQNHHLYKTS